MAKQQSFAHKSKKVKYVEKCPNCNENRKPVHLCVSAPVVGGCQFKSKMIKICGCYSFEDYISGKVQ